MMGRLWLVCRDVGPCWLIVVLVVGSGRSAFMSMFGGMPWLNVDGYVPTRANLICIKKDLLAFQATPIKIMMGEDHHLCKQSLSPVVARWSFSHKTILAHEKRVASFASVI